jgi:succinoglycan biosynthesis transport protein ExoP
MEVYSKTYSYLLERQQQAGIVKASTLSKNRVLDAPEVPLWEDSPNLAMRLSSFPLGLLLGVAIVLFRAVTSKEFQSETDVRRNLDGTPILATISRLPGKQKGPGSDPITHFPSSQFTDSMRTARLKLYTWDGGEYCKSFAITSPSSADGKTTFARSLASALCADGKSVLLVDADIRRKPKSDNSAYDMEAKGLREVLQDELTWREVLLNVSDVSSALFFIPSGGVDHPELLTTGNMRRFLREARDAFDFILLDCPSFPQAAESLALAQMVDGTLSVIRVHHTSRRLARAHISEVALFARQHAIVIAQTEGRLCARDADADAGAAHRMTPRMQPPRTASPYVAVSQFSEVKAESAPNKETDDRTVADHVSGYR